MIKQGALLVESYQDILENLNYHALPLQTALSITKPLANTALQSPPTAQAAAPRQVAYPELYRHLSFEPISVDDLAIAADLPIAVVLSQPLELELESAVCSVSGGYCRC